MLEKQSLPEDVSISETSSNQLIFFGKDLIKHIEARTKREVEEFTQSQKFKEMVKKYNL